MRHSNISLLSQLDTLLSAIMNHVGHTDHKTSLQIYRQVTEKIRKVQKYIIMTVRLFNKIL
ncbi:site-specific integrase, partial [Staphylococcus epidermidis]|nr:site-specific integrase [Staphylococcus epidermidis]